MPKKATRTRTPSRIMWDLIAAEMQRQSITQAALAKMAGVAVCTVSADSSEPEKYRSGGSGATLRCSASTRRKCSGRSRSSTRKS